MQMTQDAFADLNQMQRQFAEQIARMQANHQLAILEANNMNMELVKQVQQMQSDHRVQIVNEQRWQAEVQRSLHTLIAKQHSELEILRKALLTGVGSSTDRLAGQQVERRQEDPLEKSHMGEEHVKKKVKKDKKDDKTPKKK